MLQDAFWWGFTFVFLPVLIIFVAYLSGNGIRKLGKRVSALERMSKAAQLMRVIPDYDPKTWEPCAGFQLDKFSTARPLPPKHSGNTVLCRLTQEALGQSVTGRWCVCVGPEVCIGAHKPVQDHARPLHPANWGDL